MGSILTGYTKLLALAACVWTPPFAIGSIATGSAFAGSSLALLTGYLILRYAAGRPAARA